MLPLGDLIRSSFLVVDPAIRPGEQGCVLWNSL